jgi:hypothetical protein
MGGGETPREVDADLQPRAHGIGFGSRSSASPRTNSDTR